MTNEKKLIASPTKSKPASNPAVDEADEQDSVNWGRALRARESRYVDCDNDRLDNQQSVALYANMWSKTGPAYYPTEETVNCLPSSQYTIEYSHSRGIYFQRKGINIDDLIILPDSTTEEIISEIEKFWTKEDIYRALGYLWKRGIMLYGPPGGGKTSTVQLIIKRIIERGGISVYVRDPKLTAEGLEVLRRVEPVRPIVVVIEDFDSIQEKHGDHDLLAMLDGELQIDNVVFLATTNYPENLDARLINRPSRFDLVKQIGMPSAEARRVYLHHVNPRLREDEKELDRWLELSHNFSIAHLKEMIVSVEALEQDLYEVVDRLKKMREYHPTSEDDEEKSFGFTGGE